MRACAALLALSLAACAATPANNGALTLRRVPSSAVLRGGPAVDVEVRSDREFPVRNEVTVLRIGERDFFLSRYPNNGDTHSLIFTLTPEEFAATRDGDTVVVQYGLGDQPDRWDFGVLDKSLIR